MKNRKSGKKLQKEMSYHMFYCWNISNAITNLRFDTIICLSEMKTYVKEFNKAIPSEITTSSHRYAQHVIL